MARRRSEYGTGTVYQECSAAAGCPPREPGPDGKLHRPEHACSGRWIGQVDAGYTAQGKRRRLKVTAPTKAKANAKLDRLIDGLEEGEEAAGARVTVKAWSETWLPELERRARPSSYTAARAAVRTWIVPTIGHKRLADLTMADMRAVVNAARKEGRTSSTQARYASTLLTMLKDARRDGMPVPARVLEYEAPKPNLNDKQDIGIDQAVAMLRVAATQPDGSRWVAAFLQGLRPGERRGLTWDVVDFEADVITVCWQLQPLPYNELRNPKSGFRVPDGYEARQVRDRWHLVRPKTKSGWRYVPMVPWLKSTLLAWREVAPPNPANLIWPRDVGDFQKADDEEWRALQDAAGKVRHPAGRHYTPHETRHTTATLLRQAGVAPDTIAAILGHSKMLETYIHAKPVAPLVEALGKVADALVLPTAAPATPADQT